jgi:uncharacterized phage protein (TIGR01671 family)
MKREIKFRAINKASGQMVFGNLIVGTVFDRAAEPFVQIEQTNGNEFRQWQVDGETVGQFTGLKDKNGVEIYEGDIIYLDHWSPRYWEVTFDRGGFCMRDRPDASYYPDCKYTERSIVSGNIYENPELLGSTTPADVDSAASMDS